MHGHILSYDIRVGDAVGEFEGNYKHQWPGERSDAWWLEIESTQAAADDVDRI